MEQNHEVKWFSSDWLNATIRYGIVSVGIVSGVLGMAGDFTEGNAFLQQWLLVYGNTANAVMHLLLILIILYPARVRPLRTDLNNPDVKLMAQCINGYFLNAWRAMWAAFGVLYVVIFFQDLEPHTYGRINFSTWMGDHKLLEQILGDLADVGSTTAILFCGAYLSPMFFRRYKRAMTIGTTLGPVWWGHYHFRLSLALGSIAMLLLGLMVWGRYNALAALIYFPHPDMVLQYMMGIVSAIALGILAARMDSPFIEHWHWVILLLYLYGSMQVFSNGLLGNNEFSEAAFRYSAFSLKCVWFVFVSDQFANKRILYYAYESLRPMNERTI